MAEDDTEQHADEAERDDDPPRLLGRLRGHDLVGELMRERAADREREDG